MARSFPTLWNLPGWVRALHAFFVIYLTGQIAYATFQVFVVLQPDGTMGPMLMTAADVPHELMVARRLYAIEAWIAFVGLALYLAITEFLPRLVGHHLATTHAPPQEDA